MLSSARFSSTRILFTSMNRAAITSCTHQSVRVHIPRRRRPHLQSAYVQGAATSSHRLSIAPARRRNAQGTALDSLEPIFPPSAARIPNPSTMAIRHTEYRVLRVCHVAVDFHLGVIRWLLRCSFSRYKSKMLGARGREARSCA